MEGYLLEPSSNWRSFALRKSSRISSPRITESPSEYTI